LCAVLAGIGRSGGAPVVVASRAGIGHPERRVLRVFLRT